MDAKLSITTHCNARCKTCPVWKLPGQHMDEADFVLLWRKLNASFEVSRILLNNTGDMYNHPDKDRIFDYIGNHKFKFVIMTTNAGLMDRVPNIDELIISFNGGTKESYEYTTGLDFDRTVANIKSLYPQIATLRNAEIHCLIWEGNKGTEEQLKRLWADFPGRVRLSYKYDNQFEEDKTLPEYRKKERVYCDYLDTFSIMPNGQVISCAHDFKMSTNWGNAFEDDIDELNYHPERIRKREEHVRGEFTGLCEKCNYNTPVDDRTKYIKERDNG